MSSDLTNNEHNVTDAEALNLAFLHAAAAAQPSQKETSQLKRGFRAWYRPFVWAHKIPVFKRVWWYCAGMAVYAYFVDWIAQENFPSSVFKEFNAFSSLGIILGLLLVFRTNSAYERWWEGRKLWGQLVNDSRNLALKVKGIDTIPPGDRRKISELIISFSYALKHRLRNTLPSTPLPGVQELSSGEVKNIPVYIAGKIISLVMLWRKEGKIDGYSALQLDTHVSSLMNICGACERIKNTPIAVSYRAFMRQGIALNLLALPWYLSQQFTVWWSLPLVVICSYFLIGIELIAEDIEEPFGYDGDDLPLDNICSGIKDTISEILNVSERSKFTRSVPMPRVDLLK